MSNNTLQLNLRNVLVDLSSPLVMGVLNVTPDSFFKGNRFTTDRGILHCAEKILSEGATIIDIGGYSTRPLALDIAQDEEIRRVSEAIMLVLKKFPDAIISIDTFRSSVVRQLVQNFPIALVNDISGGTLDNLMFETIADLQVPYVLTHTRGTPQTMHLQANYSSVVSEVIQFLEKKLTQLRLLGVLDVIVDPGFGFAKTIDQNFKLLNKLSSFKALNVPILAGLSRKSMLYKTLEVNSEDALNATTAANMLALVGGANILRVHDVKEAVQAITIYNKFIRVANDSI